jgi:hypothetical protein
MFNVQCSKTGFAVRINDGRLIRAHADTTLRRRASPIANWKSQIANLRCSRIATTHQPCGVGVTGKPVGSSGRSIGLLVRAGVGVASGRFSTCSHPGPGVAAGIFSPAVVDRPGSCLAALRLTQAPRSITPHNKQNRTDIGMANLRKIIRFCH